MAEGAWIEVRKNETGEVRRYRDDLYDPSPESASEFLWTEGNYACDCNRAKFFAQAGAEMEPNPKEFACSDDAYTVIRAICDDGTIERLDDE